MGRDCAFVVFKKEEGKMKKRLLYIGSDYFGECGLRSILNSHLRGNLDVVGVITYTLHGGKNLVTSLARALNIPLFEGDANSKEAFQWLDKINPEVSAMMKYPKRLSLEFINRFKWILNAHPSDLPQLRGGAPIEGIILQNKPLCVTVHKVCEKFDSGLNIFKSRKINIDNRNFYQVYEYAAHLAAESMISAIEKVLNGFEGIVQDESQASYLWLKDIDNLLKICWDKNDVFYIQKQVLAAGPKRGAITELTFNERQHLIRVLKARAVAANHRDPLGKVTVLDNGILRVSAKKGFLLIDDMLLEDKPVDILMLREAVL